MKLLNERLAELVEKVESIEYIFLNAEEGASEEESAAIILKDIGYYIEKMEDQLND